MPCLLHKLTRAVQWSASGCALAIFLTCVFAYGLLDSVSAQEASDGRISLKQARKMLREKIPGLIILDVRTPGEYADGHISDARNMNFFGPDFEREIAALPKEAPIIVYCNSGRRSEAAAEMLRDAGFQNVYDMRQGMSGWRKAGLPVEKQGAAP